MRVSCSHSPTHPCESLLLSVWQAYKYLWLIFPPSKGTVSSMAREYQHTADRKTLHRHHRSPWFLVHTLTLQNFLPSWISSDAMLTSDFFWLWFPWGTVFEHAWSLLHSLSTTINFVLITPDHVHVLTPFDSLLYTFFCLYWSNKFKTTSYLPTAEQLEKVLLLTEAFCLHLAAVNLVAFLILPFWCCQCVLWGNWRGTGNASCWMFKK